jgi:hypothetical protein
MSKPKTHGEQVAAVPTENNEVVSMSDTVEETRRVTIREEIWQALLKIAGRQIDPATAEICKVPCQVADPYGVYPDPLPPEFDCVGNFRFARAPGSLVWIEAADLPEATRRALEKREEDPTK